MKSLKKIEFIMLAFFVLLSGCSAGGKKVDKEIFALDTIATFSVWTGGKINERRANEILAMAEEITLSYEKMLSKTVENSDIYNLNYSYGKWVTVSEETATLIEKARYYSEQTDGRFDITVAPLKDLWDFKSENPTVPTFEQIESLKKSVDYRNIEIGNVKEYKGVDGKVSNGREVRLKNGAKIDLGAIAKGYIADRVFDYMKSVGVEKGIINLGGNVLMIGEKEKGKPWVVGIQDPYGGQNNPIGSVNIKEQSVVTSGLYERYFKVDGVVYHHILDPQTGMPVDNELVSVSIITDKSVEGDALSTSCFLLGLQHGMELAEKEKVPAIFITKGGEIYQSSLMDGYDFQKSGS